MVEYIYCLYFPYCVFICNAILLCMIRVFFFSSSVQIKVNKDVVPSFH